MSDSEEVNSSILSLTSRVEAFSYTSCIVHQREPPENSRRFPFLLSRVHQSYPYPARLRNGGGGDLGRPVPAFEGFSVLRYDGPSCRGIQLLNDGKICTKSTRSFLHTDVLGDPNDES